MEILSNVRPTRGGAMTIDRLTSLVRRGSARRFVVGGLALLVVGCATTGASSGSSRRRGPTANRRAPATTSATRAPAPAPGWRVTTMEHVDLWLHGFALLTSDTGGVPFFARGYKQEVTALKRKQNLFTLLDANQPNLSARFATTPTLANAQFIAMYFPSFQEIVTATDLFIRSSGDPRAARDPQMQQEIAILASNFPQQADRNWLRLFVQSLQDENTKFFHSYWTGEQQSRGAAYSAFQEQWMSVHYPKLSRFLNNTQQSAGQLVLSVPLGGEGRTVNDGKQSNIIAVEFPKTVDAAPEALFAFVHEAVATARRRGNHRQLDARSAALGGNGGVHRQRRRSRRRAVAAEGRADARRGLHALLFARARHGGSGGRRRTRVRRRISPSRGRRHRHRQADRRRHGRDLRRLEPIRGR